MDKRDHNKLAEESNQVVNLLKQAGELEEEIKVRFPNVYDFADYQELKKANIENRKTYAKLMEDCLVIRQTLNELKDKPVGIKNDELFCMFGGMFVMITLFLIIVFTSDIVNIVRIVINEWVVFVVWIKELAVLLQVKIADGLLKYGKYMVFR